MGEQVESLKKEMEENRTRSDKGETAWSPSGSVSGCLDSAHTPACVCLQV